MTGKVIFQDLTIKEVVLLQVMCAASQCERGGAKGPHSRGEEAVALLHGHYVKEVVQRETGNNFAVSQCETGGNFTASLSEGHSSVTELKC